MKIKKNIKIGGKPLDDEHNQEQIINNCKWPTEFDLPSHSKLNYEYCKIFMTSDNDGEQLIELNNLTPISFEKNEDGTWHGTISLIFVDTNIKIRKKEFEAKKASIKGTEVLEIQIGNQRQALPEIMTFDHLNLITPLAIWVFSFGIGIFGEYLANDPRASENGLALALIFLIVIFFVLVIPLFTAFNFLHKAVSGFANRNKSPHELIVQKTVPVTIDHSKTHFYVKLYSNDIIQADKLENTYAEPVEWYETYEQYQTNSPLSQVLKKPLSNFFRSLFNYKQEQVPSYTSNRAILADYSEFAALSTDMGTTLAKRIPDNYTFSQIPIAKYTGGGPKDVKTLFSLIKIVMTVPDLLKTLIIITFENIQSHQSQELTTSYVKNMYSSIEPFFKNLLQNQNPNIQNTIPEPSQNGSKMINNKLTTTQKLMVGTSRHKEVNRRKTVKNKKKKVNTIPLKKKSKRKLRKYSPRRK